MVRAARCGRGKSERARCHKRTNEQIGHDAQTLPCSETIETRELASKSVFLPAAANQGSSSQSSG